MESLSTEQLVSRLGDGVDDADLREVDWRDLDCADATFSRCLFQGAQFTNSVFSGARFVGCRFLGARFSHADARETVFEDCQFFSRDNDGSGCVFAFTDLRQARFLKCDLSMSRFERSDLFSIEMDQCNLRGARFQHIEFSHAYSRKLVTTRASFRHCNFELAELNEARLPGADLTGSRFREADLTAADLTDAVFRDGDLFQAILTGAKLGGADLRGAEISGLNVMHLAGFARMKIDQGQGHVLLGAIGIEVHAEPG